MGIEFLISSAAYNSEHFDRIYDRHAKNLGRRPAFSVHRPNRPAGVGGPMIVRTTEADAELVRAIVNDMESAVA
ncbi:hypothetical protein ACX9NE_26955 [Mycobacterium sp. ML4]